jgi:hypothetical protein
MADYRGYDEKRIKHLEMIQAVISRLGNDSFYVKGWAVTVAGAFLGFAVNLERETLALVALVPTGLFWVLDSYYLYSEKLFRGLFELVRRKSQAVEAFEMAATTSSFVATLTEEAEAPMTRWAVLRSRTIALFYGAIFAACILVFLFLHCS